MVELSNTVFEHKHKPIMHTNKTMLTEGQTAPIVTLYFVDLCDLYFN